MNRLNRSSQYALAYASWALFILLFLVFFVLLQDTWNAFLRNYWAQDNLQRQYAINFLYIGFGVILGITWLILMIVFESYFRHAVGKGNLIHRVSKVIGWMVIAIFITHLVMTLMMIGYVNIEAIRWLLLAIEFLLGAGLIFVSMKTPSKGKKVEKL